MNYCISDIHGEYDKYISLLEKIGFCEGDNLYILGDVVDRGPMPVAVLRDMARRKNVYPIVGNHDLMAYVILSALNIIRLLRFFKYSISPHVCQAKIFLFSY